MIYLYMLLSYVLGAISVFGGSGFLIWRKMRQMKSVQARVIADILKRTQS